MLELLPFIGACLTLALGIIGLVAPDFTAGLVRISARTHPATEEFRATYGGLFIGLALVPLLTGADAAYLTVGAAWVCAAAGRIVSIVLDWFGAQRLSWKNWLAVGFEGGIGLLCLAVLV
ncbi:MAG: DUF4345 family protein [Pseudomonadota bacterium]